MDVHHHAWLEAWSLPARATTPHASPAVRLYSATRKGFLALSSKRPKVAYAMSAFGGKADMAYCSRTCPLLTQIGHRGPFQCAGFSRYDTSSEPFGTAMRRREFITLF